jgi:hypothetical protein
LGLAEHPTIAFGAALQAGRTAGKPPATKRSTALRMQG